MNRRTGKRKRRMTDQKPHDAKNGTDYAEENERAPDRNAPLVAAPITNDECAKAEKNKPNRTEKLALIAAIGGILAAAFSFWQAWIAKDTEIATNRAYVHSTKFQFINYGNKIGGLTQWIVAPIIENTGNTGTHGMMISTSGGVGRVDAKWTFEKMVLNPAVILPKSEITGTILGMQSDSFTQLEASGQQLIGRGVARYNDVFGYPHLVEFCHIAFLPSINWEAFPAGQPLRISGIQCPDHNCEDEECGDDWKDRAKGLK
jgi:hypothetical protein